MLLLNSNSLPYGSIDLERHSSLCQMACFFIYFFVKNLKKILIISLSFFILLCQSCSPTCSSFDKTQSIVIYKPISTPLPATFPDHRLYRLIPKHRTSIRWSEWGKWPLWALFGNDDDGLFGERSGVKGYHNCRPSLRQALCWWLRNPLHNFCFYVIGTADRPNSCHIILHWYRKHERDLHEPNPRLLIALHGGKPFFSLRWAYNIKRKGEFYIGWRERGNFGIKCQLYAKR